ncbi:FHA domain-containing protein [Ruminococcus sp. OA3]|uniref:DUF6382 domain-containing protein n=1 Tax=Ruminococcus sp. OA3 TaxID=2914164 RepID=UPI001F0591B9|nr:DUF6382 domain-containing protein [Ruminococcus sp. OA3]MCH1981106.1 FHA domain-containing protein [Ruminococcus sp. OA3]
MMKITYKRDYHHSYLILTDGNVPDCDSYPVRMLLSGLIPGILKCKVHHIDNQLMFYYDVTSRQSLSSAYESKKLRKKELMLIINALLNVMEEMESYLLSPSGLLLLPDYVFINTAEDVGFCYWPGNSTEENEKIKGFTEYLLPKIDHCDQDAVVLGYQFYRKALEGQICSEDIRRDMYQNQPDTQKEKGQSEYDGVLAADGEVLEQERLQRQKLLEEMTKQEEGIKVSRPFWTAMKAVSGGLLVFVYIYLLKNRYFSWQMAVITGGIFGIVLAVGIAVNKFRNVKDKRTEAFREEPESLSHIREPELDSEEYADAESVESLLSEENQTCLLYPEKVKGAANLLPVSPAEGQKIILEDGITVIGKLEGAVDVVLNVPAVSRLHAKIVCNESCKIYDMNSKNGTYVNHEAVVGEQGYEIQNGDLITFANLTYRLQIWEE